MGNSQKILIVDEQEDLRDFIEIIIESRFEAGIQKLASAEEAVKYIKNQNDVSLIISEYTFNHGGSGTLLLKSNKENKNVPFVFVTKNRLNEAEMSEVLSLNLRNKILPKPINESLLLEVIRKALDSEFEGEPKSFGSYRRVKIQHIVGLEKRNLDLFVKISDDNFVKIQDKAGLDHGDLKKYIDKGLEYIYLTETDYNLFFSEMLKHIEKEILQSSSMKDAIDPISSAIDMVNQLAMQYGIASEQIKIVNLCMKTTFDKLKKEHNPLLDLDNFGKNKGYTVSRSLLAMHFSSILLTGIGMYSETLIEKLSYAAILHDITLPSADMAEITDLKSDKFLALTEDKKKVFYDHPFQAFQMLNKMALIPPDVASIVQEHHELPDGSGFPRRISATNIRPLSAVFILALKVAHYLYFNTPSKESIGQLVSELEGSYNKGNFKKPAEFLCTYLKKLKF